MDENKNASELNKTLEGLWGSLTDEQKEKAKACKSMDELTTLAGSMGVELPDELLDSVAGGFRPETGVPCPYCGGEATSVFGKDKTPKMIGGKFAIRYYCARGNHGFLYVSATGRYYDNNEDEISPVASSRC